MLGRFWDMLGRFWAKYLCRRVEVKVKAKAKAKILFNEGVSKILGGGMPPKIFDTPSLNKILALALALTLTSTIPLKKLACALLAA